MRSMNGARPTTSSSPKLLESTWLSAHRRRVRPMPRSLPHPSLSTLTCAQVRTPPVTRPLCLVCTRCALTAYHPGMPSVSGESLCVDTWHSSAHVMHWRVALGAGRPVDEGRHLVLDGECLGEALLLQ